jgi:hypothetical protein
MVEIKLSLVLNWRMVDGRYYLHANLALTLDGEWSAVPAAWSQNRSGVVAERQIRSTGNRTPVVQPVALSLYGLNYPRAVLKTVMLVWISYSATQEM